MYNTPPCYGIYVIGLVLEWLKGLGGVAAMAAINREKAELFYGCLEHSKIFRSPVEKPFRSLMNIPFVCTETDPARRKELETKFLSGAAEAGLVNLAGHRLVGGMRASIYNAMPLGGVKALIHYIEQFEEGGGV
jgi:phosphoserine aminotransferase